MVRLADSSSWHTNKVDWVEKDLRGTVLVVCYFNLKIEFRACLYSCNITLVRNIQYFLKINQGWNNDLGPSNERPRTQMWETRFSLAWALLSWRAAAALHVSCRMGGCSGTDPYRVSRHFCPFSKALKLLTLLLALLYVLLHSPNLILTITLLWNCCCIILIRKLRSRRSKATEVALYCVYVYYVHV